MSKHGRGGERAKKQGFPVLRGGRGLGVGLAFRGAVSSKWRSIGELTVQRWAPENPKRRHGAIDRR